MVSFVYPSSRDRSSTLTGKSMTAIVALKGRDHVVVIADTLVTHGERGGLYKKSMHKLGTVNTKWVVGVADDMEGVQVVNEIGAEESKSFSNIHEEVRDLSSRFLKSYQEKKWLHRSRFLLAGMHNGQPSLWTWDIDAEPVGGETGLCLYGPTHHDYHFAAIGASEHGALYFANKFHNESASVEQNVLLAFHCVAGIAEQDRRVDRPIDLAVVKSEGVEYYTEQNLMDFINKSDEINTSLRIEFSAQNLKLPRKRT